MSDRDNNADNIMKNIDTIKMLSGMMSPGSGGDTEKILNAISTAKNLGLIGNNERKDSSVNNANISMAEDNDLFTGKQSNLQNEGIRAVKAAIPFLNHEYQKDLFLAVKLLEMNEEFDQGAMNLQIQSIKEGTEDEQRESMLRAIRGQLGAVNGKKLDVVLKMLEARKIAAKLK